MMPAAANELPFRLGCYVSGSATRLRHVLEMRADDLCDIVTIIHDGEYNLPLEAAARHVNAEYVHIKEEQLALAGSRKAQNRYVSDRILTQFLSLDVTYGLCFGGRILSGDLLQNYHHRIVNFHPSVLPSFPGLRAIDQAREKKSFLYGNTAHFIDEGVDSGPVIMQSLIHSNMVSDYDDVLDLQVPMVVQIVRWLKADRIKVDDKIATVSGANYSEVTYYPRIDEERE